MQRGEATTETGTTTTFWPDGTIFESTEWSFETLSRRLQETAFLNRGLRISLTDERPAKVVADDDEDDTLAPSPSAGSAVGKARTVIYEYPGGIADFVRYLNASKEPVHAQVIEFGDEDSRGDVGSRSRCSGTARTTSPSTRSRTSSTPPRAAPTRKGSAPR